MLHARLNSIAVQLQLMNPAAPCRRSLRQGRKLRDNEERQLLPGCFCNPGHRLGDCFFGIRLLRLRRLRPFANRDLNWRRIPHAVLCLGDSFHVAPGCNAVGCLLCDGIIIRAALLLIVLFYQEPIWLVLVRSPPAVLAFWDDSLESSIVEGMVLNLHREAFIPREVARTLRNCPALQHSIPSEPKVVVKPRRRVLLNHEW